jgi:hypothetical protein
MARVPKTVKGENYSLIELKTAVLLMGAARRIVTRLAMMELRTVSVWLNKFNACGIDGLIDRLRSDRLRISLQ